MKTFLITKYEEEKLLIITNVYTIRFNSRWFHYLTGCESVLFNFDCEEWLANGGEPEVEIPRKWDSYIHTL